MKDLLKDVRQFWIPLANVVVLAVTAYWIVETTKETEHIREDAYQQRIDSFRPIVMFDVGDDYRLGLRNIGKGPALNAELRISHISLNGGLASLGNVIARDADRSLLNLGEGQRIDLGESDVVREYAIASGPMVKLGQPSAFAIICTYLDINRLPYYIVSTIRSIETGATRKLVLKSIRTASYSTGTIERLDASDWAR